MYSMYAKIEYIIVRSSKLDTFFTIFSSVCEGSENYPSPLSLSAEKHPEKRKSSLNFTSLLPLMRS